MFGYVRPSSERLTEEQNTQFQAAYCGLCHALGRRYGLPGRMIPIPREITAGCGLSWKAAPEEGKEILAALQTAGLAYEAEYRVLL